MIAFPRSAFFLALAAASLTPAVRAQTTSVVITACVSKLEGIARIVAGPSACLTRFETVVQWNSHGPIGPAGPAGVAGPSGPTGPQGPPGVLLAHTIFVSAGGTTYQNSQNLAAAVASITNASPTNPYVVQLDAGTYDFAGSTAVPGGYTNVHLPPFVSIKGAGIYSTLIASYGNTIYYNSAGSQNPTVADLSGFSVIGYGGYAVSMQGVAALTVDHVQASGYAQFTTDQTGARVFITNSIFNGPTQVSSTKGHATIQGTQIYSLFNTNAQPGVLACFSDYDVNLQPYPAGCVSSGP